MNNLQIFENAEFGSVRTTTVNCEVMFVGKDVADILGYQNGSRDINRHVDEDDRQKVMLFDGNQDKETIVINESGLYSLVLSSKMSNAKKFKRWVTSEVLPSIRKHGAYMTPQKIEDVLLNPDTIIKLATELKAEQEKRVALESKVEQDKPLVAFANSVSVAKTSILVGELAKLLKQNGVDMGQNRLFTWMRENGYLISRKGTDYNMPTQRSMEMKLFEIKETTISHGDGHTSISKTPKVTGKGQIYFINLFLGTQQDTDNDAKIKAAVGG
jgi:anti-repressor protein